MALSKFRIISAFAFSVALFLGVTATRVRAQATTATILGTVTDASGAAVPDATVRITNTGTAATQVTMTDTQGRYRVSALPIGDYDVQGEKAGFEIVVRKGITLSVGADVVVDVALPVGQVTQSITVESQVSQVETQSTAVSNLVEPTQMRELPLNGRNFEQLILLSPGVTIHQAIGYTAVNGFGNAYSVSGSRTRGQWELLDDNDVMNWQGRGSGAGVLGTQLGVDAIAEFQVLTNTYSAQYGGNGAVVTSVTRSGTNNLHGSGYEFIRNSALDARNFFDPAQIPEFQKNQFGGTLGGPIKRDKMFFFFNYEGIRQTTGEDYPFILPDGPAHSGFTPNAAAANGYACVNTVNAANPTGTIAYLPSGANNAACLATVPSPIQNLLKYFPMPSAYPFITNGTTGLITAQETASQPGSEDYLVGRYDWTISQKDSFFTRYLRDSGNLFEPFNGPTLSPGVANVNGTNDRSLNQYLSIEERHIWSGNVITSSRAGYVRTLNGAASAQGYSDYNWGQANLWNGYSSLFPSGPQGSISILPLINPNITRATLGNATAFRNIQNKYSGGEDIYWNKGAHSLQFGVSIMRVQSYGVTMPAPGSWTFTSISTFLTMSPTSGTAVCNAAAAAYNAACKNLPPLNPVTHINETDLGFYGQDAWKLRSNVTLNLGLRYSPSTIPKSVGLTWEYFNLPGSASYNPALAMPGCLNASAASCPASLPAGTLPLTPTHNVYQVNSSFHNFEPRIGIAWDPFADHKTSVRAGYGIFRSPVLPYDYTSSTYIAQPYLTATFSCPSAAACSTFPLAPFSGGGSAVIPPLAPSGVDPGNRSTPYIQQYNMTVQRQIANNTTLSIGYIGSHSIHLLGIVDENAPLPDGVPGAIVVANTKTLYPNAGITGQLVTGTCPSNVPAGNTCWQSPTGAPVVDTATGQNVYSNVTCPGAAVTGCAIASNAFVDPTIDIAAMRRTTFWGKYNSLQVGLARRMTNNLSGQISYTFAECRTNSSGSTAFENALYITNPWNANADAGNCGFLIRHDLSMNGLYMLPFKGNRLVSGWQLGGVFAYHTGSPINMSIGYNSGILVERNGPLPNRVNQVAGCNPIQGTVADWFHNACFTQPPVGENGNAPAFSVFGPDFAQLDTSLVKNTKLNERFGLQFRAEFFNLLNRPNFRNPGQPMSFVFAQNSPLPATCATTPSTCSTTLGSLGNIILTNGTARQIQFGLKFTF